MNLSFRNFIGFVCGYKNSSEKAGNRLLKQLSHLNRPLEIEFKEMLTLMNQCDIVEKQNQKRMNNRRTHQSNDETPKAFQFKNNPFSVFSGIIPGTKWCGTGDIATTYSDLGKLIPIQRHKGQYNNILVMSHQYQFRRILSIIFILMNVGDGVETLESERKVIRTLSVIPADE